jgi:hypothetical protein
MTLSVLSLQLSSRGVMRTKVRAAFARPAIDACRVGDIPNPGGQCAARPPRCSGRIPSEQLRIFLTRAASVVEVGVDIDRLRHVRHAGKGSALGPQQGKCGW